MRRKPAHCAKEDEMDKPQPPRKLLPLLGAGAVGLLLGLGITALRILYTAPTPEDELAAALDSNAVFQLAIQHDPSLRAIYLARLKSAYAQGGVEASASEAHVIGQEISRAFATTLIVHTSDAVLSDFLDVTTRYLAEAYETDPEGCYAFVRGQAAGTPLPPEVSDRLAEVMLNVVATATNNPVTMDAGEWEAGRAKIDEIRTRIASGGESGLMYFGDYAGRPATTAAERKGTCLLLTRIYQDLGRTEAPLRYQALRALSSPRPAPVAEPPQGSI
jgi:hypothetical protein